MATVTGAGAPLRLCHPPPPGTTPRPSVQVTAATHAPLRGPPKTWSSHLCREPRRPPRLGLHARCTCVVGGDRRHFCRLLAHNDRRLRHSGGSQRADAEARHLRRAPRPAHVRSGKRGTEVRERRPEGGAPRSRRHRRFRRTGRPGHLDRRPGCPGRPRLAGAGWLCWWPPPPPDGGWSTVPAAC